MPCSILSLDVQDIMGSHTVNVEENLYKNRLSKTGQILGKETLLAKKSEEDDDDMSNYENVKMQVLSGEGCNVYGDVFVKKVPGNFHISSHAYGHFVSRLAQEGHYSWDVSHRINHFYVGETSDISSINKSFKGGILSPLDGMERFDYDKKVYEYYLRVKINFIMHRLYLLHL